MQREISKAAALRDAADSQTAVELAILRTKSLLHMEYAAQAEKTAAKVQNAGVPSEKFGIFHCCPPHSRRARLAKHGVIGSWAHHLIIFEYTL